MPRVELPELLLEVQTWTGFASDFTHVNEHGARADDLPISVCAVLLAEACNVGLEPLVRPEIPALTRARSKRDLKKCENSHGDPSLRK